MLSAFSAPARAQIPLSKNFFASPQPAGRRITAGFTWLQRIGKAASYDVWFPNVLRAELTHMLERGLAITSAQFPADWAAIRQVELLQESGNYKIYDLDVTHLTRTLVDLTRNMRSGGYRVTIAMLGSYSDDGARDDLEILDQQLQARLSQLIHMLYLEEQSAEANEKQDKVLAEGLWDFRTALPHIGVTLGARDLFHPDSPERNGNKKKGGKGQGSGGGPARHILARKFFDILSLLPQKHIVHDTAIGLQLPESINENEWIYLAQGEDTLRAFNSFTRDVFGASGANIHHMRGHGDRLTPEADGFYRNLARFSM